MFDQVSYSCFHYYITSVVSDERKNRWVIEKRNKNPKKDMLWSWNTISENGTFVEYDILDDEPWYEVALYRTRLMAGLRCLVLKVFGDKPETPYQPTTYRDNEGRVFHV